MAHLRIGEDIVDRVHRAEADLGVAQQGRPLGERLLAEGRAQEVEHLVATLALGPLVGDELLAAEEAAQVRPEVPLERADGDVAAIGGLVDGVAGMPSGNLLRTAPGRAARELAQQQVVDVPGDGPVEHRDVDPLAATSRAARE